jgi:hypothetical protein
MSDTPNLSDNLDEVLSSKDSYRKQLEELQQKTQNKYCLWHRRNFDGHVNNFGLMYECKDCMKAVENGRCTIDVTNFDLDVYWNVRNFWLKVDIKEPDQCWRWLGATRRNEQESIAYMPSPFHSAKTQSAPRVAFWLSRGYTGKYRIMHQEGCGPLCCNPLHLRIKEVESGTNPNAVATINLNYGNIFQRTETDTEGKLSDSE